MEGDSHFKIGEPQRAILFRMGFALLFIQTTEKIISTSLTYVLPESGVVTLEMMLSEVSKRKLTLGQFLVELRKRVDIDDQFDMILTEFLDKRNTLFID